MTAATMYATYSWSVPCWRRRAAWANDEAEAVQRPVEPWTPSRGPPRCDSARGSGTACPAPGPRGPRVRDDRRTRRRAGPASRSSSPCTRRRARAGCRTSRWAPDAWTSYRTRPSAQPATTRHPSARATSIGAQVPSVAGSAAATGPDASGQRCLGDTLQQCAGRHRQQAQPDTPDGEQAHGKAHRPPGLGGTSGIVAAREGQEGHAGGLHVGRQRLAPRPGQGRRRRGTRRIATGRRRPHAPPLASRPWNVSHSLA